MTPHQHCCDRHADNMACECNRLAEYYTARHGHNHGNVFDFPRGPVITMESGTATDISLFKLTDSTGREVFRITPDRRFVFAEDIEVQDGAGLFAQFVTEMLERYGLPDVPVIVEPKGTP